MKKIICIPIALLIAAAGLTGCGADKEEYREVSYSPEETVSAVSIDVRDREIEVSPSEDGRIHISCFESGRERYDISVSDSGTLTMAADDNKAWSDYIGAKASSDVRKITLLIPDELLDTLDISTTNEDIILNPVNVGRASLNSNGGNILFEKLNAASALAFTAKNGSVSGTLVGGYDDYSMSCSIKKGECSLPEKKEGGEKALTVSVNNGDIEIDFA